MIAGRRRRGIVLLGLALACGGVAASSVDGRMREVEEQLGPLVPVVVATNDAPAGRTLSPRALSRGFSVREVPRRFRPPDALAAPEQATGLKLSAPIAAGGYLTLAHLQPEEEARDPAMLGRGERAVEVLAAGGAALAARAGPGSRVDVLVTTQPESGLGRTYIALEDVELLDIGAGGAGTAPPAGAGGETAPAGAPAASALATLRVTPRQAVFLTAAQNFAREVRLLVRAPDDRRRAGAPPIAAGDL